MWKTAGWRGPGGGGGGDGARSCSLRLLKAALLEGRPHSQVSVRAEGTHTPKVKRFTDNTPVFTVRKFSV